MTNMDTFIQEFGYADRYGPPEGPEDRPLRYTLAGPDTAVTVCRSCLIEIVLARTPEDAPAEFSVAWAEAGERCGCGGAF